MKTQTNRLQGVISISSKGTGYVAVPEGSEIAEKKFGKDPEIDFRHLNTALHGDTVEIVLHPLDAAGRKRQTAEVTKIVFRAKIRFAGVLEKESEVFFLKPDDTKMYTDILVPKENLNSAKDGQKVFVEIVSWHDAGKAPLGKVVKILGTPGDNDTEMLSIAIEKGFDEELPGKVHTEADNIKQTGIKESDYRERRDFRKILTFTIDPNDAKDFDDAISFREVAPGEYEVGVHVADVSHYVKVGSALDHEASERGTSVYLVDRTIPMLPETLSNDLCSLVQNKDRLTMSAVFIIDKNAKIKSKWFGRTVIHSQKRLTYKQAEESIKIPGVPLHKELFILNNLAKKLTEERFRNGAMLIEQDEVKFVLDKDGVPIKVTTKERGDSNKLIEEFMLLANKSVAELMFKGTKKDNGVFIYRVHDLPSKEKMADLAFFLSSLGYKLPLRDGIIPTREINKLLKNLSEKNTESIVSDTIQRAIIRSMAKAIYSTKNIGHYGLAFKYYTNFTSPIRRYPDIIVHRLLNQYLAGKKVGRESSREYEKISRVSSEQEKRASDAERSSIKYKQVEYMSKRLGEKFEGVISGITEWGIYVEEVETKCEGLIKVRNMKDDFYVYNEKKLELVGQKRKKTYKLGNKVKMKVKDTDLEHKTIDYVLV